MNAPLQTVEVKNIANQELVTLDPKTYVAAVYEPFSNRLQAAIESSSGVTYAIATKEGMATAKECRALFRTIRLDCDKERAARKAPIISIGKLLESAYTEIETAVKAHEDKFDSDIKAEEARIEEAKAAKLKAEEDAKAAIQNKIDAIKNKPLEVMNKSVAEIEEAIAELSPLIPTPSEYGERFIEAEYALKGTLDTLHSILNGKKAQEQLDAQNRALQAEQAAKEAEAQLAAKEQARVDGIKSKIQSIKNFIIEGSECETSAQLNALIEKLDAMEITDALFAEFVEEALSTASKTLQALHRQHAAMFNAEQAEAAREAKIIADANAAALEKVRLADLAKDQAAQPAAEVKGSEFEHFKKEAESLAKPVSTVQHFMGVEPSVNDLVNAVAKAFGADVMMAHKWLLEADFTKYQQAA